MLLVPTTIVGMTVVMTAESLEKSATVVATIVTVVAKNATVVMTAMDAMSATVGTIATERSATRTTAAAGKSVLPLSAPNAPDPPLVVPTSTIVAPGRLLTRRTWRKGGLQGTMIAEVRMMIVEDLTLILIVAGTNVAERRRTTGTRKDPRGPTEITVGHAE